MRGLLSVLVLGVILVTVGCNKQPPTKEQEEVIVNHERLKAEVALVNDKVRHLANVLIEEQLKTKYVTGETIVLDKQVLELIKILDEYTELGPQITRSSEVNPSLAWKFIAARDKLVKERLKEIVTRREEYRKETQRIWKKFEEDKKASSN